MHLNELDGPIVGDNKCRSSTRRNLYRRMRHWGSIRDTLHPMYCKTRFFFRGHVSAVGRFCRVPRILIVADAGMQYSSFIVLLSYICYFYWIIRKSRRLQFLFLALYIQSKNSHTVQHKWSNDSSILGRVGLSAMICLNRGHLFSRIGCQPRKPRK